MEFVVINAAQGSMMPVMNTNLRHLHRSVLKVNFDVAEQSLLSLKCPWAPNPAVINSVDTVGAGMKPRFAA